MSGHKIVPLLEKHKDVFVHGGTVSRHKQAFVDGRKKIPEGGHTELVLCASATFKLWQGDPKPHPSAVPKGKESDAEKPAPPPPLPPRPMLVWRQPHCFIKSVVPMSNKTNAFAFGFAVIYFAPAKEAVAKPVEDLTEFAKKLRSASNFITVENSLDLASPPLRIREYRCASEYEQEDWCFAFRSVLCNYWHERLEAAIIPAPEVFQYHVFAVDVSRHPLVDSVAPHTAGKAPVVQIAISTEKVYCIPRHDQAHLERDHTAKVQSFSVGAVQEITVFRTRGNRLEIVFAPSGTSPATWKLACLVAEEGAQLVVELQRIWDLTKKNEPFPFVVK